MSTLYADHGRIINSQEPLPIPIDLMTKLWENPSPSSAFASQNINLSSSDYDFLLWIVKSSTTDAKYFSSIVEKGQTVKVCNPFYYSGMYIRQRTFTYSSDTVYVAEDADQNGTTDNIDMIPISVYGFKKQVPMQASSADLSVVAPVLSSFVATASIKDKGTQFIYNSTLYEITTTVTAGTTFVVSTNVKTLGALVNELSSSAESIDVSTEPLIENFVVSRCGKIRILKISFSLLTSGSNQTSSAIIPEGDRPLFSNDFDCAEYGTGGDTYRVTIFENGYIHIFAPATKTPNMWATCMYVTP